MNFYLDLEATSPGNEIISIGVVAENGEQFYSLIRPQFSTISPYITSLTHLTPAMFNNAEDINSVMNQLGAWLKELEPDAINRKFYTYSNGDKLFFETTLNKAVTDANAFIQMATIFCSLHDATIEVFKYFYYEISLIKAYNFIMQEEKVQMHNALDDALMLKVVYEYVLKAEPLAVSPFTAKEMESQALTFNKPSGKFFIRIGKKNKTEIEFANIDEAVNWLLETKYLPEQRENIHRDKMMGKIMKSVRTHTPYNNYYWRREK